jgi:hypothetical protein
MLITSSDMNIKSRGAITSSENSLEEEEMEQMPKFKTGSGARIDHLLYANSLVPFIHFPPPPVAKLDPPVAKGKGCKAASSSLTLTVASEVPVPPRTGEIRRQGRLIKAVNPPSVLYWH